MTALERIPPPKDLEPVNSRDFSPEDVDRALMLMAVNGGERERTAAQLKEAGLSVSPQTLSKWATRMYPVRYAWIARNHAREIEDTIIEATRETVLRAQRATSEAVDASLAQIKKGEAKDPAAAARNLATVAGIGTTKLLELTGRPTSVVEHRSGADIMRQLEQRGWVVEGSAEEVVTAPPKASLSAGEPG